MGRGHGDDPRDCGTAYLRLAHSGDCLKLRPARTADTGSPRFAIRCWRLKVAWNPSRTGADSPGASFGPGSPGNECNQHAYNGRLPRLGSMSAIRVRAELRKNSQQRRGAGSASDLKGQTRPVSADFGFHDTTCQSYIPLRPVDHESLANGRSVECGDFEIRTGGSIGEEASVGGQRLGSDFARSQPKLDIRPAVVY